MTLNKTELFLEVGGSESLKAEVLPKEATDKKITWTTSDENIATVSSSGNVKGVKVGSATITATADGKSVTCTVKVGAVAESVVISAPQKKGCRRWNGDTDSERDSVRCKPGDRMEVQ